MSTERSESFIRPKPGANTKRVKVLVPGHSWKSILSSPELIQQCEQDAFGRGRVTLLNKGVSAEFLRAVNVEPADRGLDTSIETLESSVTFVQEVIADSIVESFRAIYQRYEPTHNEAQQENESSCFIRFTAPKKAKSSSCCSTDTVVEPCEFYIPGRDWAEILSTKRKECTAAATLDLNEEIPRSVKKNLFTVHFVPDPTGLTVRCYFNDYSTIEYVQDCQFVRLRSIARTVLNPTTEDRSVREAAINNQGALPLRQTTKKAPENKAAVHRRIATSTSTKGFRIDFEGEAWPVLLNSFTNDFVNALREDIIRNFQALGKSMPHVEITFSPTETGSSAELYFEDGNSSTAEEDKERYDAFTSSGAFEKLWYVYNYLLGRYEASYGSSPDFTLILSGSEWPTLLQQYSDVFQKAALDDAYLALRASGEAQPPLIKSSLELQGEHARLLYYISYNTDEEVAKKRKNVFQKYSFPTIWSYYTLYSSTLRYGMEVPPNVTKKTYMSFAGTSLSQYPQAEHSLENRTPVEHDSVPKSEPLFPPSLRKEEWTKGLKAREVSSQIVQPSSSTIPSSTAVQRRYSEPSSANTLQLIKDAKVSYSCRDVGLQTTSPFKTDASAQTHTIMNSSPVTQPKPHLPIASESSSPDHRVERTPCDTGNVSPAIRFEIALTLNGVAQNHYTVLGGQGRNEVVHRDVVSLPPFRGDAAPHGEICPTNNAYTGMMDSLPATPSSSIAWAQPPKHCDTSLLGKKTKQSADGVYRVGFPGKAWTSILKRKKDDFVSILSSELCLLLSVRSVEVYEVLTDEVYGIIAKVKVIGAYGTSKEIRHLLKRASFPSVWKLYEEEQFYKTPRAKSFELPPVTTIKDTPHLDGLDTTSTHSLHFDGIGWYGILQSSSRDFVQEVERDIMHLVDGVTLNDISVGNPTFDHRGTDIGVRIAHAACLKLEDQLQPKNFKYVWRYYKSQRRIVQQQS